HLAVRPVLRRGQLLLQPDRRAAAAVPQLAVRGALRDRDHDDLGLDRVLGGDLPGRLAGGAAAADRGGRDRRGRALAGVPPGHAPAAQPGLAVPGRLAHDQRAPAVRRGVPVHPGRPAQRHHRPRLLPVQPGLPAVQLRLCVGHRLLPVPRHHRGHRHPVPGGPAIHVLPVLMATSAPARDKVRPAGRGGVPAPRRRWRLPFSPWHLVLLPATLVLLFPFAWLLMTSVETQNEALHFPPILTPHQFRFANYPDALNSAPFGHFFANSAIVAVTTVVCNLVLCSLAGYAFARFRFLGRTALFAVIMATLMVPFQVTMIPQFIIVKWLGVHVLAGVGIDHIGALILPNAATAFGIF